MELTGCLGFAYWLMKILMHFIILSIDTSRKCKFSVILNPSSQPIPGRYTKHYHRFHTIRMILASKASNTVS